MHLIIQLTPTIEIQEKIVKILDKFTNYVTELQAELQARKKQYEYYRDMLLSEEYLNRLSEKIDGLENYNEIFFAKVSDLCVRQKGINITAEKMKELNKADAPVKIFAGGNTVANVDVEDVGEENIINIPSVIIKSRGNIDFEYYDKPFSHKNEMWSYSTRNEHELNVKFLYYLLKNNLQYFKDHAISGKLPQISTGVTDNYKIPIPNIKIQNKVVEILDQFQSLLSDTQGLLPQEMEQRRKQYEYYREKLLTFGSECDNSTHTHTHTHTHELIPNGYFSLLKEAADFVGVNLYGFKWEEIRNCVLNVEKIKWKDYPERSFQYIDLSAIDRNNNKIMQTETINADNAPSRAQQIVHKSDVLFGTTRPLLQRYCLITDQYDKQICSTGFCVLRANKEKILPKWLLYTISTTSFLSHIENYEKGTSYPAISDGDVKLYEIPLPSLPVQEYVVSVLDTFDTLVRDVSEGLPREIELRQKQYEYYREKLLSFRREEPEEM